MSKLGAYLATRFNPEFSAPQSKSEKSDRAKPLFVREPSRFDKLCDAVFGFFENLFAGKNSASKAVNTALNDSGAATVISRAEHSNARIAEASQPSKIALLPRPSVISVSLAIGIATVEFTKIAYPQRAVDIEKGPFNLHADEPDYGKAGKALEDVFLNDSEDGAFAKSVNDAVLARDEAIRTGEKNLEGPSRDSVARHIFDNFYPALKELLAHNHSELEQYTGPNRDVPKNFAEVLGEAGRQLRMRAEAGRI